VLLQNIDSRDLVCKISGMRNLAVVENRRPEK
jgi:hypothetical protein